MRAVIDSRLVTHTKTAADSVLGAQCLARPDSRHLLIVGAGAMASTLARANDGAFPSLERISIWSRRPEQARGVAATLGDLRSEVAPVEDLPEVVGRADMVSSATMAREPVLLGKWVRPGTHIDLIGAFTPDMREADDALIASALVYVDYLDTVVDQIGELMQPIQSGAIARDHVRGDLYDLVATDGSSRQKRGPNYILQERRRRSSRSDDRQLRRRGGPGSEGRVRLVGARITRARRQPPGLWPTAHT